MLAFSLIARNILSDNDYSQVDIGHDMTHQIIDLLCLVDADKTRQDRLLSLFLLQLARTVRANHDVDTQGHSLGPYLKYILEKGADPNISDQGWMGTPLSHLTHKLVEIRDKENTAESLHGMIVELVRAGADPSIVGKQSMSEVSPLFIAARGRVSKLVRLFLESKKNGVYDKDQSGASVLHYMFSVSKCDPECIPTEESLETFDLILQYAPELVNAQDNKSRAPLSWAIENGFADEVAWLLERNADVNDEDELGQTALHDISEYFNIESSDETSCIAIIRHLLDHGADMRICTKSGTTAFAKAVRTLTPDIIREFIKYLPRQAGDIDREFLCCRDINGENILHYAARRQSTGPKDVKFLEELLRLFPDEDRKSLLSQEDNSGLSPLQRSAMSSIGLLSVPIRDGLYGSYVGGSHYGGLGWAAFGEFRHPLEDTKIFISEWGEEDGDVVGMGFEYESKRIFFIQNGKPVGTVATIKTNARWVPAITVGPNKHVRVNFGTEPFSFKGWEKPMEEIEAMIEVKEAEVSEENSEKNSEKDSTRDSVKDSEA
ncbi:Ankyrin-2 [Arthrobotrys entomopaga]|nr:Ankyrin-2 [Arthrobotrys entomopaga]